jgi:hypothetical protein
MTDYATVLLHRHPNREWKLDGDDYEGLTMLDDGPKPSKKSLDDAWPEVQAEIAAATQAKANAAASARAKLAALGLSEAEVSAIIGG